MTQKNERNLSVLFWWSLGPDQPGVSRRVGMSSCLVKISHFLRQFGAVRISSSPKNFPTWALLNQSCSSLSTNTSISLKLSSSDFLLSLETFKTEDIFTFSHFGSRMICMWSPDSKMVHVYVHNFSVSFFCLLTCTNLTTLMDAKQWVVALF